MILSNNFTGNSGLLTPSNINRDALQTGVAFIGATARFPRACPVMFLQKAAENGTPNLGILGIGLGASDGSRERFAALEQQDGLYTLVSKGTGGIEYKLGTLLKELVFAPDKTQEAIARLADPAITLSLVILTQSGYYYDSATGGININSADVQHDIKNPANPKTGPGLIVAAMRARMRAGVAPFTPLSCEAMAENGATLGKVVISLAEQQGDAALTAWLREKASFPCAMVDRIVPKLKDSDIAEIEKTLGYRDNMPMVTEPFLQWVLEEWKDMPASLKGALTKAGVQIVQDVKPYERAKLLTLNATHTLMAYICNSAGFTYVDEVVNDPDFAPVAHASMAETQASLQDLPGQNMKAYRKIVFERFQNPHIRHELAQIAHDGTNKIRDRQVAALRANLKIGAPIDTLCLAIAGWINWAATTENIDDRTTPDIGARAREVVKTGKLDAVMSIREAFGDDLPQDKRVTDKIDAHLKGIQAQGPRDYLLSYIAALTPAAVA
ncbi:MAG: hypothetical protein GC136_00775 [Alphaproteobacteria bacterium]|nr:hypothetical protein [Alphaproteobacteria bacterium]